LNVDNVATGTTRIVGNVTSAPALFGLRQDAPAGTAFFAVVQNSTTNIHGTAIVGTGGGLNPGSAAGTTGGIGVNAVGGGNAQAGTTGGIGLNAVGSAGG